MLAIFVVYGFPIYWMVSSSVKPFSDLGSMHWIPSAVDVGPYIDFIEGRFFPALRQSMLIAGLTTGFTLLLAIPAAFGLARVRSRLIAPILFFILIVQMVPTSATFIPLFLMLVKLHMLDTVQGVAFADSSLLVPFAILVLRPAFEEVPVEIEDAAAVDGAGSLRYLFLIAIPVVRNSILVIGAITFVTAWGELVYALTFLLTEEKYPISVYIAESIGRYGNNFSNLMAVAAVACIPVLLVVIAIQRHLRKGLTLGAVR